MPGLQLLCPDMESQPAIVTDGLQKSQLVLKSSTIYTGAIQEKVLQLVTVPFWKVGMGIKNDRKCSHSKKIQTFTQKLQCLLSVVLLHFPVVFELTQLPCSITTDLINPLQTLSGLWDSNNTTYCLFLKKDLVSLYKWQISPLAIKSVKWNPVTSRDCGST